VRSNFYKYFEGEENEKLNVFGGPEILHVPFSWPRRLLFGKQRGCVLSVEGSCNEAVGVDGEVDNPYVLVRYSE
jgi:hypothetical protein